MTVKHNIKLLVEKHPEVKDNYNLLSILYWEKFEGAKIIKDIEMCTPSESITRAFRSLVRSGHIELSEETRKNRRYEEKEFIKHYHKEKI